MPAGALFSGFFVRSEKITELIPRCLHLAAGGLSAAEQVIESGLGSLCLSLAARAVRIGTGLEPVAEIRPFFVAHLFGTLLVALACQSWIVELTQATAVQIGTALWALRETTQRQKAAPARNIENSPWQGLCHRYRGRVLARTGVYRAYVHARGHQRYRAGRRSRVCPGPLPRPDPRSRSRAAASDSARFSRCTGLFCAFSAGLGPAAPDWREPRVAPRPVIRGKPLESHARPGAGSTRRN